MSIITVSMGDMRSGQNPDVLTTMGVGSCLVVILYDLVQKIGCLGHAMLPSAPTSKPQGKERFKYVDTTIDCILEQLLSEGAEKEQIAAKLVGGAHMFPLYGEADHSIGARNIEVAHRKLQALNIGVAGEEIGGSVGRNVRFNLATGICDVETRL